MFSFFKKKGSRTEGPRPPEKRPAPAPRPAAAEYVEPRRTLDSFEVSDTGSGLSGAAEEAAIQYANGKADAAIAILLRGVAEGRSLRGNRSAWFMLFDLFQLQGMRQEFEKLALDFVVQFERSAPVWVEARAVAPGVPARKGPVPFVLGGVVSGESARQIADVEAAAARDGALHLDLGKIRSLDDAGCTLLVDALERILAAGRPVELIGARGLEKLLREQIDARGKSCAPCVMLLLMNLYQLEGMHEEFENLALDYAVAYEVSPPPWEPQAPRRAAQPLAEYAAEGGEEGVEALHLSGAILGASPPQLQEIVNYAASRAVVSIDLSRVPRVDFLAAGALLNVFMSLAHGGKGIMIQGANELIQALFTIVGINQHVVVARNKQH